MKKLKIAALIPARYESSRFPGKLLKKLGDKSIIQHVFLKTKSCTDIHFVAVVTNNEFIAQEIKKLNGDVFLSSKEHESGTDRIAEIANNLDFDFFINVQGDEPFVDSALLIKIVKYLKEYPDTQVLTAKHRLNVMSDVENSNNVKIVTDNAENALYFSRSVIPFNRDKVDKVAYFKHIGIYAFRKDILLKIAKLEPSKLEKIEKLENLRYLENGIQVKVIEHEQNSIGIDTEEDYKKAIAFYNQNLSFGI